MKVVLLSHVFGPNLGGGATAAVIRLARGLRVRGEDVTVITTRSGPPTAATTPEGIRVHTLPPMNLYWVEDKDQHSLPAKIVWQVIDTWNPRLFQPLRDLLIAAAPDIIHSHKLRGLSPAVWSAAAASGQQPLIQTCQDYETISPEGTLTSRVGRMAERGAWSLRPYQALRARWSDAVDVVTAPSRYTLDQITARGFFPRAEQIVVPNSHGKTGDQLLAIRDARKNEQSVDENVRFLYLGRLEAIKGIAVLVEAFRLVAKHASPVELHIAGFGTLEDALRQQIGGHPQIKFHGALFGREKDELVRSCAVQIVPSVWPEVFGNVIVEAYAWGKPVIASRVGGIPELVDEGETGFLVPANDVAALAAVMESFIRNPKLPGSMADACYAAASRFTLEAVTDAYVAAYQLAQRSSQPESRPNLPKAEPAGGDGR